MQAVTSGQGVQATPHGGSSGPAAATPAQHASLVRAALTLPALFDATGALVSALPRA